jgi:CHAT domain-containing protein/tetratricopeptide (TPR) repeat protein
MDSAVRGIRCIIFGMQQQIFASTFPLLGDSIIYEENKGDFTAARRSAESAVQQTNSAIERASTMLELAIVQTLQGDCADALKSCHRASELAANNPALLLRATATEMWICHTRWNYCPDGAGSDAIEAWTQWPDVPDSGEQDGTQNWYQRKAIEFVGALEKQWNALEPLVPDGSHRMESTIIYHSIATLSRARARVQKANTPEVAEAQFKEAIHPLMYFLLRPEFKQANPRWEAAFTMLLADLAFRARNYKLAQELINSAAAGYLRAGDRAGAGSCFMQAGDFRTGPLYTPVTLHFPITESASADSSDVRVELHEQAASSAHLALVRDCYAKAADEFHAVGAVRGLAALDLRRSCLEMWEGRVDAAREYIDAAIKRYTDCGDRMALVLSRIHRSLTEIARHPALEDLETAADIGKWGKEGSYSFALGLGIMLGRAGRAWLIRRGDAERALACFRMAKTLFEELGAPLNTAQSIADQGTALRSIGDHQAAAAKYEEALSLYLEQAGKRRPGLEKSLLRKLADAWSLLYGAYEDVADPEGIQYAVERLDEFRHKNGLADVGDIGLGGDHIRSQFDRWDKVTRDLDISASAVEAATEAGDKAQRYMMQRKLLWTIEVGKVTAACYKAKLYDREGNHDDSAKQFLNAFKCATEAAVASRDFLQGIVHAHRRDYANAIEAFRRYWDTSGQNDLTKEMVDAMVGSGADPSAAKRHRRNQLEQRASALIRLQDYAGAEEYVTTLDQEFGPEWWRIERTSTWEVLAKMAEVREGRDDTATALQLYAMAIADLEQKRAMLFREAHKLAFGAQPAASAVYLDAARVALKIWEHQGGEGEQAREAAQFGLYCAQLNHARSLEALLTDLEPDLTDTELQLKRHLDATLSMWRGLLERFRREGSRTVDDDQKRSRRLIAAVEKRLREDDETLHRIEFRRASVGAVPRTDSDTGPPESLADILPTGTALIQYAIRGRDLLMWAVNKDGIIKARGITIKEFEIDLAVRDLRSWKQSESIDAAEALTSRLLEPLSEVLEKHHTLTIIPSGATHRLPFHALPWQGEPLIAGHTVTTLPIAPLLNQARSRAHSAAADILVAGVTAHPAYFYAPAVPSEARTLDNGLSASLDTLFYAGVEAQLVARILNLKAGPLLNDNVTRETVLATLPRAKIIHLATHAVLLDIAPLLSSIVLANGDGITATDLLEMKIDAELAVLSACRTAEGRITYGNDVVGITRALLLSGVRNLVVTLWRVDDLGTPLLMQHFYELLKDGRGIADALRTAQLWLRRLSGPEAADLLEQINDQFAAPNEAARFFDFECQVRLKKKPFANPLSWAPFMFVGSPQAHLDANFWLSPERQAQS